MKFVKKIGNGDIKIKDNEVIEKTETEKADEWAQEFTQNFQVPLHEIFLTFLQCSCLAIISISYMSSIMRKPDFCLCENKGADQLRSKQLSAFVFATWIVQFLFFLNLEFPVSSHLLIVQLILCLTWSKTQIVGFLMRSLVYKISFQLFIPWMWWFCLSNDFFFVFFKLLCAAFITGV